LQRENDRRGGEQNDDGEVDPTHGGSFSSIKSVVRGPPITLSATAAQTETYSDPACARHDQIDAKRRRWH
jgi:hypothetical protein